MGQQVRFRSLLQDQPREYLVDRPSKVKGIIVVSVGSAVWGKVGYQDGIPLGKRSFHLYTL